MIQLWLIETNHSFPLQQYCNLKVKVALKLPFPPLVEQFPLITFTFFYFLFTTYRPFFIQEMQDIEDAHGFRNRLENSLLVLRQFKQID